MSASTRWLAGVAGLIAVLVVASIAVTALAGGEREFPEGTAERAVQHYLAAVADRDSRTATSFFSAALAERCDEYSRDAITMRGEVRIRASLDETIARDGGVVQVRVRLSEMYGSGGPFDAGEYTQRVVFDLAQEDGEWRFVESPWPFYCPSALPATPRG